MDRRFAIPILVALLFLTMPFAACTGSFGEEGDPEPQLETYGDFLIDYGNGNVRWIDLKKGSTVGGTVSDSLSSAGISYSGSGSDTVIDGISRKTVGGPDNGGSLSSSGTTGNVSMCSWHFFTWDSAASEWKNVSNLSTSVDSGYLAAAYYPDGIVPAVTPDHRSAWTMLTHDSQNSLNQTIAESYVPLKITHALFGKEKGEAWGDYSGVLYSRGNVYVKMGNASTETFKNAVYCYDAATGEQVWMKEFTSAQMEIASGAIVGDSVYFPTTEGYIHKYDAATGELQAATEKIPGSTVTLDGKASYGMGPASLIYDTGAIYCKSSNGMLYCFDLDLNLLWSYQMLGANYYSTPTVSGGHVLAGAYNGTLYSVDQYTGAYRDSMFFYMIEDWLHIKHGAVNTPVVFDEGSKVKMIVSYSDGLGMNSEFSSAAVVELDKNTGRLTKVLDIESTGIYVSTMLTKVDADGFKGVVFPTKGGVMKMSLDGVCTNINDFIGYTYEVHAAPTLVNDKYLYFSTYDGSKMYQTDLNGEILGEVDFGDPNFSMAMAVIVDGFAFRGDDNGFYIMSGSSFDEFVPPVAPKIVPLWEKIAMTLGLVVAVFVGIWGIMRFGLRWEHPFSELRNRIYIYFYGEEYTHNTKSKRKLHIIILTGISLTVATFLASLCIGSQTTLGLGDALSCMMSSIQKGGHSLTYEEMLIYNERLPRAIAALAVGLGLSIAGALYQAVIKNPLVEPYIMGVSSGAGTMAIAVLVFDFTLFGLLSPDNIYLTAISAIIGGLLAFGCTMFLAEKTGGKSVNYVLAGIVVGLVFSAIQSLMIIKAGNEIGSALSWLYGSFTSMTWDKVWLVLVPTLAMSFVPLVWAKELNLVLLGEDQAMQMGLNAKRFDRCILILASVITAVCVAFCGIIGFVGLVIPHLSRMIVGGDHRLMLPTSMAFGGFLMIAADLLARILLPGMELPVGAVTTAIGVPVFAYLLLKRGKSYDI